MTSPSEDRILLPVEEILDDAGAAMDDAGDAVGDLFDDVSDGIGGLFDN